jgi:pyruvate formate lyase activating enzyme
MITRRELVMSLTACAGAAVCGHAQVSGKKYQARFWHKSGDAVYCDLCPHECVLPEGKTGICRNRKNVKGTLVSLGYAYPCAIHADPIEKKPLYHMLPGSKTFSLGIAGCNLRCKNCQNYTISQNSPLQTNNTYLPPAKAVEEAIKMGCSSIAYTYSEPVVWIEYVLDTALLARKAGLKNVLVSAGYINQEPLMELCKVIDGANIDLKSFDDNVYHNLNAGKLKFVLETLVTAKKAGVWVEIVNLIVPQWTDNQKMIREMCRWIKHNLGSTTPLHFSRFFPMHKLANLYPTPADTLENARKIALEEGLRFVYIGNVSGINSDTHCLSCGELLISRKGYYTELNALTGGVCAKCKQTVPGLWGI